MTIKQGIRQIEDIVGRIEGSEAQVLDALMDLAEGWKMRLQELHDDKPEARQQHLE